MLYNALLAARELQQKKIESIVLNLHTVKPLDEETILRLAKKARAIVTVEEHSVLGGVGSAVSEMLARKFPVPIEFVGVQDVFGQSGTIHELWKKYHLDVVDIVRAAQKVIRRK